jgi:hypothetical protein
MIVKNHHNKRVEKNENSNFFLKTYINLLSLTTPLTWLNKKKIILCRVRERERAKAIKPVEEITNNITNKKIYKNERAQVVVANRVQLRGIKETQKKNENPLTFTTISNLTSQTPPSPQNSSFNHISQIAQKSNVKWTKPVQAS